MIGLGTLINVAGITAGGLGGLLFGKKMEERYQRTLMSGAGICVLFLGIEGVMEEMLVIRQGELAGRGTMMLILSFFIGSLLDDKGGQSASGYLFGSGFCFYSLGPVH